MIVFLAALALSAQQGSSASAGQEAPPVSAPTEAVFSESPAPTAVQPQTAKIVMFRGSSVIGAAVACPIRYKGKEVVELARGKYAEWEVPPGRYILGNKTTSVEVSVAPAETRYVRCSLKMGFFTGRADLQIVDEDSFREHASEFEKKPVAFTLTQ